MKLNTTPRVVVDAETSRWYNQIATQVNALSEGKIAAKYTASASIPTTGTWAKGDQVTNSSPSELGTAGSKYVIDKWICTASGTPGTWLACRNLTGN